MCSNPTEDNVGFSSSQEVKATSAGSGSLSSRGGREPARAPSRPSSGSTRSAVIKPPSPTTRTAGAVGPIHAKLWTDLVGLLVCGCALFSDVIAGNRTGVRREKKPPRPLTPKTPIEDLPPLEGRCLTSPNSSPGVDCRPANGSLSAGNIRRIFDGIF
eukprot:159240-Pyramimonas_sp.AAC.1